MSDYKTLSTYKENYYFYSDYNSAKFDIVKSSDNKFKVANVDSTISSIANPMTFITGDLIFSAEALPPNQDIKSVDFFMRYESPTQPALWSPVSSATSQYFQYNVSTQKITIKNPSVNLRGAPPTGFVIPSDPTVFVRVYLTWGPIGV